MLPLAFRGCIFDVDGTLVRSNAAHAAAWSRAFAECGMFDVSPVDVHPYIGMGGEMLVSAVKPRLSKQVRSRVLQNHHRIFNTDYLHRLKPTPGAKGLLRDLNACGVKLVVATSATGEELSSLLEVAGVGELLPLRVSADDVCRAKPAPDLVEAALEKIGERAGLDVVMIGDTPYDIEAAVAAGVRAIALRSGGRDDKSLAGAEAIFDDPEHLRRHLLLRQSLEAGHA